MEFTPELARRATRIGGAVIASLVTGMAVIVVLNGIHWRPMRTWSVFGGFGEGFAGLRVGSPVRVGGVTMGRVTEIELNADDSIEVSDADFDKDRPSQGRLLVTFTLDGSIDLRANAIIVHDVNPFSGIGELDILRVGTQRVSALPGQVGSAGRLAPGQPWGRPFALSRRGNALRTILGTEGAADWARIFETIDGIEQMFLASTSPTDHTTGEEWGPNHPGAANALIESARALRTRFESDIEPWNERVSSIRGQIDAVRGRVQDGDSGSPTLAPRIQQLTSAFGKENGLRSIAAELQPLFDAMSTRADPIMARFDDAKRKVQAIGAIARGLWPEIVDDMQVTRAGFVIGASELWLASGPEFWTTLVRAVQPMSQRDQQALVLILSANRVALSAENLHRAIDFAQSFGAEPGVPLAPEVRAAIEGRVVPALARYRRDLSDLMQALERFANAR